MPDLRDYCDRLWRGEIDTIHDAHPVTSTWNNREPAELADGFLYIKSAASMNTLDTGDGLVMLDTGTARDAEGLYSAVRDWRPDTPLRAAVFSHHHVDHIFGVNKFDEEAAERGQARPIVYGQRHIPAHFDRYKRTVGYNTAINSRQFIRPGMDAAQVRLPWPDQFRYPDVTFDNAVSFSVGELTFEVTHTRGETEDAAWTWVPERRWLFPGDLFIWAVPNAGNPQKAQRWVGEWAAGLRQMAGKGAEVMSPGHGFPIFGAERIAEMRQIAVNAGRNPADIGIEGRIGIAADSQDSWGKLAEDWASVGATHLSVNTMRAGLKGPDQHIEAIQRFKETVSV